MNLESIMKLLVKGGAAAVFLLLTACQTVNYQKLNISEQVKDPKPDKILFDYSPELLTNKELESLLRNKDKVTETSQKADRLFSSAFVDNSHYRSNGIPKHNVHPLLGPSIRLSTWNIEKSIHVNEVAQALSSEKNFIEQLSSKTLKNKRVYSKAVRQRAALAASDILLLQEMDIGHCRSDYVFAAQTLAQTMGMNYVYAPQQLEIDPFHLMLENIEFGNQAVDHRACMLDQENSEKYKGVFGVAVLSRYPIKRVQVFPLKHQPYDWYDREIVKPDFLEETRRFWALGLFKAKILREVKYGGRGFTRVDLHVPDVPHETITVINVHLEIKAEPKKRVEQLTEILSYIKDIENPVVMAGDFNSASRDLSATSVVRAASRTVKNPWNITSLGLFLLDVTGVYQFRNLVNGVKNFQDPFAIGVPWVLPNKKKSLFKLVENYRFKDGGAFDFRGDAKRSINGFSKVLSNSNQRSRLKGFTNTFSVPKPIGPIGLNRLDWIFVKSFLNHPRAKNGPYKLAPHFGETLNLMNTAVKRKYSDHHPITTIIPLTEPEL